MENILTSYSKVRFWLLGLMMPGMILCSSCGGDEKALKTETLYFNEFNAEWISNDSIDNSFVMVDNNGISQSFTMRSDSYYFNESGSSFLGINTRISHTEYHYQYYKSSFGTSCSISLTAGNPPYGDVLFVIMDGVGFAYDFDFEIVSRLDTPFGYKSMLMTEKGYEEPDQINSRVELLDSMATAFVTYEDVLHFTFNDFKNQWTDFTVSEIYLAKGVGLVKYKLAGGITTDRVPGQD